MSRSVSTAWCGASASSRRRSTSTRRLTRTYGSKSKRLCSGINAGHDHRRRPPGARVRPAQDATDAVDGRRRRGAGQAHLAPDDRQLGRRAGSPEDPASRTASKRCATSTPPTPATHPRHGARWRRGGRGARPSQRRPGALPQLQRRRWRLQRLGRDRRAYRDGPPAAGQRPAPRSPPCRRTGTWRTCARPSGRRRVRR